MPKKNHKPWSDAELRIVKDQYEKSGLSPLAKQLGRTAEAIRAKGLSLGLKLPTSTRIKWTDKHSRRLVRLAAAGRNVADIATAIGTSSATIRKRARLLDIPIRAARVNINDGSDWTPAELVIIEKYYPEHGAAYCADYLPGRTEDAITKRAAELKIYRYKQAAPPAWSNQHEAAIRALSKRGVSLGTMARELDITPAIAQRHLEALGLPKPNAYRRKQRPPEHALAHRYSAWTAEQLKYLRKHYETVGVYVVAHDIGRPSAGVRRKAHQLGLKAPSTKGRRLTWTGHHAATLERLAAEGADVAEIAAALCTSQQVIHRRAKRQGVTIKSRFTEHARKSTQQTDKGGYNRPQKTGRRYFTSS